MTSVATATEAPPVSALMRAAVLEDVGRIELRDVPRPALRPDEVRVRVQAVGICGTDLHIVAGHANYNRDAAGRMVPLREEPQILGHEITGIVEEMGAAVRGLESGEHVVLDQGRSCVSEARMPRCEYCVTGDSHQCEHYREHGITGLPGGFAEYVTIPAVNAVAIRSSLEPVVAALTEPLGCVVHTSDVLLRTPARYTVGSADQRHRVRTALVCGAGPAGLLFVQYLRGVLGFDGLLIVSEPEAHRRALAERFGAVTVDPRATDLVAEIHERTAGRRVELLVEASGAGALFTSIPALLRKQGTLVLYGHGHAGTDLSVLNSVQFLEPTVISTVGASGGHDADGRPTTYVRALRLIEEHRIEVAPLVTHRYPSLDALPAAFAGDHAMPGYVKGVLTL